MPNITKYKILYSEMNGFLIGVLFPVLNTKNVCIVFVGEIQ